MRARIFLAVMILSLMALYGTSPQAGPTIVLAADGTTGSITAGFYEANFDVPIVFWLEDLAVSSDYGIAWGESTYASQWNFTTGSSQTTYSFTESFESADTSSGIILVGLWGQTDCNGSAQTAQAVDYVMIRFADISENFPTGFFITLGVALILVLLVAAIVRGLIHRK
ncbi:MAG: hypothetical protein ACFFCW_13585 [Candidatus Hodarchaeota archaeon]